MKKLFNIFMLFVVFFFLIACKEPENDGTYTYTGKSNGNKFLPGSPYGYEMWDNGNNGNYKMIWYGPDDRGGAAFRAEWNNPNDFLGRVGYYWGNGGKYASYGNIFCDFEYTRSADKTAGPYSYIGIYGWSRNPLVEYYIVEDWFSNNYYSTFNPVGKDTIGVNHHDTFTVDGSVYYIYKKDSTGSSIDGQKTFTQYFNVRQSPRKSGTISITKHFDKWAELGMPLGNMYECKFLVEAGGGIGWFEASYLTFYQD